MTYKPESFDEIVGDAADALMRCMDDGWKEMEIEFPPVPSSESYKTASDTYIDANTQLALQASRKIHKDTGKKCTIVLPDGGELDRSSRIFKSSLDMLEGIDMSHLYVAHGALRSLNKMLGGIAEEDRGPSPSDVHFVINISTKDLPDARKYQEKVVKAGGVFCFFNCELETLRGDLGQFTFPPKSTHYEYLSRFKPVFYIRQREYSKTINKAPYIVNYAGCLFREYPGPWQVMLKQNTGEYACVAEDATRYTLGEVKAEMMEAMGLNTEAEGSRMQFLRRGYKYTTWWEEDEQAETSDAWRT